MLLEAKLHTGEELVILQGTSRPGKVEVRYDDELLCDGLPTALQGIDAAEEEVGAWMSTVTTIERELRIPETYEETKRTSNSRFH